MSEFKGTPGPWVVCPTNSGTFVKSEQVAGYLAEVRHCRTAQDVKADARLIAAAPDLLGALIWMVENDETNEGDEPLPDHNSPTWSEINSYWISGLNRARAAIAKATGEPR